MAPSKFHHHGCQTVSKAELQKAFSALLMSQEPGALYAKPRDPRCELERSEFCSTHGVVKELLGPQNESAPENIQKRTLRECLAPEEWITSQPVLTLAALAVLLFLILVLVLTLAACSGRRCSDTPVTPVTPLTSGTLRLLACPKGWVGYRGVCYYLSKNEGSWDRGQALCSELGASLAMPKHMHMELLFRLSGKDNHWLGLRRRGQGLQWADGSSLNSSVKVLGNEECVFLDNGKLSSRICSNLQPYICSKPQSTL